jgi:hypothetical protein
MADAFTRQAAALYSRLHGRGSLVALLGTDGQHTGVYLDEIPAPALYPAVVMSNLSLLDIGVLGPARAGVNAVWLVKAVVAGRSYAPAQAIMDEVDAELQSAAGVATAGALTVITSERVVADGETTQQGDAVRHLGRHYRVLGPAY